MCGPVQAETICGYDPASKCAIVKGIATRYWGDPEQIQKELMASGFTILEVSIEHENSHGNIIIQTRKSPKQEIQVRL
jgi:hypothetical protein